MTSTSTIPLPSVKLDDSNYKTWEMDMKECFALRFFKDSPYLSAIEVKAGATVSQELDSVAKYAISHSVSAHLKHIVLKCATAAEAWKTLANMYRSTVRARKHQLTRKLGELKQGSDESIRVYFSRATQLELDMMHAGIEMKKEMFVEQVLANTHRRFRTIIRLEQDRLEGAGETVDLDSLLPALLIEEVDQEEEINERSAAALVVHRPPTHVTTGAGSSAGPSRSGRFNGKCHHCGIVGHRKAECRKLKRDSSHKMSHHLHKRSSD
jgi:hypothetical protein